MKIELYDNVVLKDGRRAAIVENLNNEVFLADVGSSPEDWDTIEITKDDIESVIKVEK